MKSYAFLLFFYQISSSFVLRASLHPGAGKRLLLALPSDDLSSLPVSELKKRSLERISPAAIAPVAVTVSDDPKMLKSTVDAHQL